MLSAQVESFEETLPELKPLLPTHWAELALHQDKVPLDPQYDIYIAKERAGEVMFITLRELGQLLGYFIGFVAPGLHYRQTLTLQMDIFYVWPSARGTGGGQTLFKFVENEAKRRGVKVMYVGSKLHKDASWLFQRLGYQEVERYYTKSFFEEAG